MAEIKLHYNKKWKNAPSVVKKVYMSVYLASVPLGRNQKLSTIVPYQKTPS